VIEEKHGPRHSASKGGGGPTEHNTSWAKGETGEKVGKLENMQEDEDIITTRSGAAIRNTLPASNLYDGRKKKKRRNPSKK